MCVDKIYQSNPFYFKMLTFRVSTKTFFWKRGSCVENFECRQIAQTDDYDYRTYSTGSLQRNKVQTCANRSLSRDNLALLCKKVCSFVIISCERKIAGMAGHPAAAAMVGPAGGQRRPIVMSPVTSGAGTFASAARAGPVECRRQISLGSGSHIRA